MLHVSSNITNLIFKNISRNLIIWYHELYLGSNVFHRKLNFNLVAKDDANPHGVYSYNGGIIYECKNNEAIGSYSK